MKTRILGIDFGLKRVGLSLSDEMKILASPLPTMEIPKNRREAVLKLHGYLQILEKEHRCKIEEIVLGYPLLLNGEEGFLADEVKQFKVELEGVGGYKIHLFDERMSSKMVENAMREGGVRRKARSSKVDQLAAIVILQGFLDKRNIC